MLLSLLAYCLVFLCALNFVLFVLFCFFFCFASQLAQDTVSDPGVCVADIKTKLYLDSLLRH